MPTQLLTTPPTASIPALSADREREWAAAIWAFELASQSEGPLREHLLQVLNDLLYHKPALPKAQWLEVVHLIDKLQHQQEAAELAANPARRAGIERVGAHFARKAQSGFFNSPLPDEKPE